MRVRNLSPIFKSSGANRQLQLQKCDSCRARGLLQVLIERGQRQARAYGELEVSCIVCRQPVLPGQSKDLVEGVIAAERVNMDGQRCADPRKTCSLFRR